MDEQNKLIEGMVRELLEKNEEDYQKCKVVLMSKTAGNNKLRDFVCKLFSYTDKRRPLLIGVNS